MKWEKGEYVIYDIKSKVNVDAVKSFLKDSFWAPKRTKNTIQASIKKTICFSLYKGKKQIGFSRVLTDDAVYAFIMDFIIDKEYRGKGLGKWLMNCMKNHPKICNIYQMLWTPKWNKNAIDLYKKADFKSINKKIALMIYKPEE